MQVHVRDVDLISGLERTPRGGQSNTLQYSFLENPMDRGAWLATAHGVAKSQTGLKRLSIHMLMCIIIFNFRKLINFCLVKNFRTFWFHLFD